MPDWRDNCKWYGGDCGQGENCSTECYEPQDELEGGEKMKYCVRCGYKGMMTYCPECGGTMRPEMAEENGEIFVRKTRDDFIVGEGYHVACGGVVDLRKSSTYGFNLYVCRGCCTVIKVQA